MDTGIKPPPDAEEPTKPLAVERAQPSILLPGTPLSWRFAIAVVVLGFAASAYLASGVVRPAGQALLGVFCFLGVAALFSSNLRALNWRTLGWGFALQLSLALFVLKFEFGGVRPGYEFFRAAAEVAKKFLAFSDAGAQFVFGKLADPKSGEFIFAFRALPTIIFVSSFFTVLYYYGVLQWVVRLLAVVMRYLMRTSGAETLSVTANVVMGQTEAPLMVKPYVERMTTSELLALMVGGMAHISGALMAVYIGMGADPVAILATSVMASPCSLYLAKIIIPETAKPETSGDVKPAPIEQQHANVIDAAASGASDGVRLAINIAAMLIAFLAFIALFDFVLKEGVTRWLRAWFGLQTELSLSVLFGWLFSPIAYLLGLSGADVPHVGELLGIKLVANEFVAYTRFDALRSAGLLSERAQVLATYALTGFANIASIGIQLGGIGALAPSRRSDLARLGPRALLAGFLVTLVNAAIAGVFL
jgi:CNT family concentrative nucleoside transporter